MYYQEVFYMHELCVRLIFPGYLSWQSIGKFNQQVPGSDAGQDSFTTNWKITNRVIFLLIEIIVLKLICLRKCKSMPFLNMPRKFF